MPVSSTPAPVPYETRQIRLHATPEDLLALLMARTERRPDWRDKPSAQDIEQESALVWVGDSRIAFSAHSKAGLACTSRRRRRVRLREHLHVT